MTSVLLLTGVILWTLFEYGVHRALHSWLLMPYHSRHHNRPRDPTGGDLYYWLAVILACLIAYLEPALAPCIAGFLIGYGWFWFVHHATHHRPELSDGLLASVFAWHCHHHRDVDQTCFGVTTNLWDCLFKTIPPRA